MFMVVRRKTTYWTGLISFTIEAAAYDVRWRFGGGGPDSVDVVWDLDNGLSLKKSGNDLGKGAVFVFLLNKVLKFGERDFYTDTLLYT